MNSNQTNKNTDVNISADAWTKDEVKHLLAYRGGWGGARLRREKGRGRRKSEDRGGRRGGDNYAERVH